MNQVDDDLQRSVAQILNALGWLWWHTPNRGFRNAIEAKRFYDLGVKPGAPDILVFERWFCDECYAKEEAPKPCSLCHGKADGFGIAIKLKAGDRGPTPFQQAILTELQQRRFLCAVCWSVDEIFRVLRCVRGLNGRRLES